jgi:UDP-GlcNAc:undecaprenyl-phosphate GlcNAc-1-phosphate transferase
MVLAVFGAVDDFRGMGPYTKLAGQTVAAVIVVWWGGVQIISLGTLLPGSAELPVWIGVPFTIFVIVGVTNAINLADGLDGLAGGMSLLIFAGIGYLAYLDDCTTIAMLTLALSGALFGFLRFNTHPASIFIKNTGSQFLGFSAITLSLALTQGRSTPLSPVLPLILLGFPVLDTLTVMVTRKIRGVSPFAADKNHFHHNLMTFGFRHSESVLIMYVIQTILLLSAVFFRFYEDRLLLAGYCGFSVLVLAAFSYYLKREQKVSRPGFIDEQVTGRLRRLKDEGVIIWPTFRFFEMGIPVLLLITSLVAKNVPVYISICCLLLAGLLLLTWRYRRKNLKRILQGVLYLLIPFAVYFSDAVLTDSPTSSLTRLYNGAFGVFAVLIIVISKFSRRENGFKSSPMDFLIIIVAIVVPNFPDHKIQEYQVGILAAKIIMLYFSFEVLLAELRVECRWVALATVASLIVLAV